MSEALPNSSTNPKVVQRPQGSPRPERIRIRFSKFGRVRFTSHRDVARIWERSLRRTRLPVSYSEGYSPRPRLRFGLALATSYESCGEYLDVDLEPGTEIDVTTLGDLVNPTLPPGIEVQAVAPVAAGTPSLQEAVESCSWLFEVDNLDPSEAAATAEQVLAAPELPVTRERKGKQVTDDLRPSVRTLRVADPDECPRAADWPLTGALLLAELGTKPRSCRPAEVLAAIDDTLMERRVVRINQWTNADGVRCEPLEVVARPSAPHAQARAS